MRYRKLTAPGTNGPTDPGGDMVFGGSQQAFFINQPEAVGQAVQTRLGLWLGQWYLNPSDGTPYNTQVLGKYTGSTRDAALQARALQTPGVNALLAYSSVLDTQSRIWSVSGKISTIYGIFQFQGPI